MPLRDTIDRFKRLNSSHQPFLIEAAYGADSVWINMLVLYGFAERESTDLRSYLKQNFHPNGTPR